MAGSASPWRRPTAGGQWPRPVNLRLLPAQAAKAWNRPLAAVQAQPPDRSVITTVTLSTGAKPACTRPESVRMSPAWLIDRAFGAGARRCRDDRSDQVPSTCAVTAADGAGRSASCLSPGRLVPVWLYRPAQWHQRTAGSAGDPPRSEQWTRARLTPEMSRIPDGRVRRSGVIASALATCRQRPVRQHDVDVALLALHLDNDLRVLGPWVTLDLRIALEVQLRG